MSHRIKDPTALLRAFYQDASVSTRGCDAKSAALLQALGYLPRQCERADDVWDEHFLDLAAQLTWIEPFNDITKAGPNLFGAVASASAFGLTNAAAPQVNAGGRGYSARQAFESCIAEAIERLCVQAAASLPAPTIALDHHHVQAFNEAPSIWPSPVENAKGSIVDDVVSDGSGACGGGKDYKDAILSAVFEAFERDAVAHWWFAGQPAVEIPGQGTALALAFGQAAQNLRKRWLLDITLKDAGVPVVAALSASRSGTGIVVGCSAAPTLKAAGENASLELFQMEYAASLSVHKEQAGLPLGQKDKDWLDRLATHNTTCPVFNATKGRSFARSLSKLDLLASLLDRATAIGSSLQIQDISRPISRLRCVKAVAQNLQTLARAPLTQRLQDTQRIHKDRHQQWQGLRPPIG